MRHNTLRIRQADPVRRDDGAPREPDPAATQTADVDSDGAVAAEHRVEPAPRYPPEPLASDRVQECAKQVHASRTSQRPCRDAGRSDARVSNGSCAANVTPTRDDRQPCRRLGTLSGHANVPRKTTCRRTSPLVGAESPGEQRTIHATVGRRAWRGRCSSFGSCATHSLTSRSSSRFPSTPCRSSRRPPFPCSSRT